MNSESESSEKASVDCEVCLNNPPNKAIAIVIEFRVCQDCLDALKPNLDPKMLKELGDVK